MYREVSRLLLYSNLGQDSILLQLSGIFSDWAHGECEKPVLVSRIYQQVKRLLDLATRYGFNCNLWHDYLTFVLMMNENSFSLTCERVGASDGSVNHFAKADFAVFKRLFHFDFAPIEPDLGIDCFTVLENYTAIPKKAQMYYRTVSEKVRALSAAMMLRYAFDMAAEADCIERAVDAALNDGLRTADIVGQSDIQPLTCTEMTDARLARL